MITSPSLYYDGYGIYGIPKISQIIKSDGF